MGSLIVSPKLPIAPQLARTTVFRHSGMSSGPTLSRGLTAGRVRLPSPLVRASILTLLYALFPRDPGAPSPAIFLGSLLNSSIGVMSALSAWTFALVSAAAFAVFFVRSNGNSFNE